MNFDICHSFELRIKTLTGVHKAYHFDDNFFFGPKSRETYYARCQELEKFKKDGSSPKEIEKVRISRFLL